MNTREQAFSTRLQPTVQAAISDYTEVLQSQWGFLKGAQWKEVGWAGDGSGRGTSSEVDERGDWETKHDKAGLTVYANDHLADKSQCWVYIKQQ